MRTKMKNSTKKMRGGGSKNNRKKNNQTRRQIPLEEILQAAETAVTACDVDKGIQLYSKAVTILQQKLQATTNIATTTEASTGIQEKWQLVRTLEKLGELKVSIGEQDGAKIDFRNAIGLLEQDDNEGSIMKTSNTFDYYDTYSSISMYIGQLCVEEEAKVAFEQGVSCLESCMSQMMSMKERNADSTTQLQGLNRKLCTAYCAVAELYLTDLCYEDDAETKCEFILEKALQIKDSDGQPVVDALQTMASLRLSQNMRRREAAQHVLRAYEKMRVGCEALADLVGISQPKDINESSTQQQEKSIELQNVDAANSLPEFEFRCQTAKLLLECADIAKEESSSSSTAAALPTPQNQQEVESDQCVSAAIAVLGSLLSENDEVIEIWYLSGCAFAARNQVELASYYFRRSMEMLLDIKKSLEQEAEFADGTEEEEGIQEQLEQNKSLLEDVQTKLQEAESAPMDTSS